MYGCPSSAPVRMFRTLKVFTNGTPSEYGGPRKADGIISLMKKWVPLDDAVLYWHLIVSTSSRRSLPPVSFLAPANHTEFSQSDKVVVVAYLDSSDTANMEVFKTFAEGKRDDYVFGWAHETAQIKDVADVKKPTVVVWKKFDEGRNDLHVTELTADGLEKFVKTNSVPLLDEVSPSNFQLYAEAGLPLAYVFIESNNPHRESLVKSLEPVAREHKGKINFVWIDATKFADHAKSLNLMETNWPSFAIQDLAAQTKFPLDQHKTVDHSTVAKFVKEFAAGTLSPSLKSQPIPKKQGEGSHVLVTDEFEKVVYANDNKKDVFIEFCMLSRISCGLVGLLADDLFLISPFGQTLLGADIASALPRSGTTLHTASRVSVMLSWSPSESEQLFFFLLKPPLHSVDLMGVFFIRFDATENDVPPSTGVQIQGFPTLKFKKAGSKEFIDYEGDRSLDSLIEFVEKHTEHRAVKVEIETSETDEATDQVVLNNEESADEEDKDAEHDEL